MSGRRRRASRAWQSNCWCDLDHRGLPCAGSKSCFELAGSRLVHENSPLQSRPRDLRTSFMPADRWQIRFRILGTFFGLRGTGSHLCHSACNFVRQLTACWVAPIGCSQKRSHVSSSICPSKLQSIIDAPSASELDGIRDRAMLHLCFAAALRVSELVGLRLNDATLRTTGQRADSWQSDGSDAFHYGRRRP